MRLHCLLHGFRLQLAALEHGDDNVMKGGIHAVEPDIMGFVVAAQDSFYLFLTDILVHIDTMRVGDVHLACLPIYECQAAEGADGPHVRVNVIPVGIPETVFEDELPAADAHVLRLLLYWEVRDIRP